MDPYDHDYERGLRNRRAMLGDAWVDRATTQSHAFNADFQQFITRYAWHEVWGRPGLGAKTRRVIVLAITCALGRWEEFELHLRAALVGGSGASLGAGDDAASALTPDEVKEVLIQAAIYAGVPAANTGMAIATKLLRELGHALPEQPAGASVHPGCGRSMRSRGEPSLHVTVREARSASPAGTLVFSHALGADASMWDAVANRLAQTHRVVCYDHRGHGDSAAPPGPYTMAQLADDAAALIDELDTAGPVIWVGLSLGGMVGQELAVREPQRLAALVIANSCARFDAADRQVWLDRLNAIEAGGMDAVADAVVARWFSDDFRRERPAEVARWRRRLASDDARGYVAAGHAVRAHDALDRLGAIRIPTLVIAGEHDPATPVALSRAMVERISGARLEVMPGVAHVPALEQPASFSELIERFVETLRAAAPVPR